jgi:hypothetical protein
VTSSAPQLQVRFFADSAALIALLQHEARISRAYRAIRRRHAWHAAAWGLLLAAAFGAWRYVQAAEDALALATQTSVMVAILWCLIAMALLTPPGFYRLIDLGIRRRIQRGGSDADCGPYRITLVDEGIVCEGAHNCTLALWSEVERVDSEPDAIYIDLANGRVFRIPRLAFRHDNEFRQFVEFACARLPLPATRA